MTTISIEEAQANLLNLISDMAPGDELVITQNTRPIAKLISTLPENPQPIFGRGKGKITIVAEDDVHLEAFKEFMP